MKIIPNYTGDPFVLKDGGDYYMVLTSDSQLWQNAAFACYHSKDLKNWSEPKCILDLEQDLTWAKKMAWAPTLLKHDGYYYFCFVAEQQIGIAVCEEPMGKYRDILGKPLLPAWSYGFQTIDPALFKDDDGKCYLLWGQGKCYMQEIELSPTEAKLIGEPKSLSDDFYWQCSQNPENFDTTVYNEAPDLIKWNGRYLLTWSIYDTRDVRYQVRYAWADNVWGPYIQPVDEAHDNILIHGQGKVQCTGHAAVNEYNGELYLFYHRFAMPRKGYLRETCCDKIHFIDEDHIVVFPTVE
ncbi:MAG: family 43 glycosylhydrolase [Christensenellaceae bacterium]|nr:family 43 glycosylhydrolase [Christensenellaceae bacterium]